MGVMGYLLWHADGGAVDVGMIGRMLGTALGMMCWASVNQCLLSSNVARYLTPLCCTAICCAL